MYKLQQGDGADAKLQTSTQLSRDKVMHQASLSVTPHKGRSALLLAPMEGLLDHSLRDVLTRVGGIDFCVSEFIRITDQLMPLRVFTRVVPELRHASCTPAGVPVRVQLLGSDPMCLAENAACAAQLKPAGIDLNFGCPAKTVNRHRGGAALLDEPQLIGDIVAAVRRAVPANIPVSAKMRLGYLDELHSLDCALAIADSGADQLVVHARTKAHGYRAPAYWDRIAPLAAAVRAVSPMKLVANGEIWTLQDALHCRAQSGCDALMLGRGMVVNPGLGLSIVAHDLGTNHLGVPWTQILPLLGHFWKIIAPRVAPKHLAGRLKQWLNFLRRHYAPAQTLFTRMRMTNDPHEMAMLLFEEIAVATPTPQIYTLAEEKLNAIATCSDVT